MKKGWVNWNNAQPREIRAFYSNGYGPIYVLGSCTMRTLSAPIGNRFGFHASALFHCKVVKYSDFKFCSDVRADRLVGKWTFLIEHMDPVCIPYALQGDPEDHLGAILGGSRCCPPLVVESMAYFFKGNFVQRDLVVIPNVH